MANEISTFTDLNGVTHDIEDSTARSAIQTLDGQAVKSVNGQTPTAGAVLIGAGNIGYDNTSSGMTADDLQEAVDELHTDLGTKANTSDLAAVATSGSAADVSYDNTNSGLTADDVQEAVDELNGTLTGHTSDSTIHVTSSDKTTWNGKQDALTFDNTPTASSTNPVTSGGVKTALDNQQYFYIDSEGYGCINYDLFQTA